MGECKLCPFTLLAWYNFIPGWGSVCVCVGGGGGGLAIHLGTDAWKKKKKKKNTNFVEKGQMEKKSLIVQGSQN